MIVAYVVPSYTQDRVTVSSPRGGTFLEIPGAANPNGSNLLQYQLLLNQSRRTSLESQDSGRSNVLQRNLRENGKYRDEGRSSCNDAYRLDGVHITRSHTARSQENKSEIVFMFQQ